MTHSVLSFVQVVQSHILSVRTFIYHEHCM